MKTKYRGDPIMEINLVGESLKFMALGMIIVLFFLVILVQVMKLQAKLVEKYFAKDEEVTPPKKTDTQAEHVAAIVAAVSEFRKQ